MDAFEKLCELFRKRGDAKAEKALKIVSEEWRSMQKLLEKEVPSIKGIKKKWKKLQDATSRSFQQIASSLQSEESESDSDSSRSTTTSSESESSSSSDGSDEESSPDEESSSESGSNSSSEESNSTSSSDPVRTKQQTSTKAETQKEDKSRLPDKSGGSNSEKGARQNDLVKNKSLAPPVAEESSSSSSSSSSDDDSDSGSDGSNNSSSKSDESSSDSHSESDEESPPKKKRKTENGGNFTNQGEIEQPPKENAAEETDEAPSRNGSPRPNGIHDSMNSSTPGSSAPNSMRNGKNGKQRRKSNAPFQRIKVDAVKFADERLKDNSFHSRGAKVGDYGAKAHADLVVTRGDSFRKEKNKKKRGSYRGGEITLESHSIKFS